MAALGPQRLSDVDEAQQKMVKIAKELAKDGHRDRQGRAEDEMLI